MLRAIFAFVAGYFTVRMLLSKRFWITVGVIVLLIYAGSHGWFDGGTHVINIMLTVAWWALIVGVVVWIVARIRRRRQLRPGRSDVNPPIPPQSDSRF